MRQCPYCHAQSDEAHAGNYSFKAPVSGDINLCTECAGISVFTDNHQLREPTPQETLKAFSDPELVAVREYIIKTLSTISPN